MVFSHCLEMSKSACWTSVRLETSGIDKSRTFCKPPSWLDDMGETLSENGNAGVLLEKFQRQTKSVSKCWNNDTKSRNPDSTDASGSYGEIVGSVIVR
jgi:hypothetical protein